MPSRMVVPLLMCVLSAAWLAGCNGDDEPSGNGNGNGDGGRGNESGPAARGEPDPARSPLISDEEATQAEATYRQREAAVRDLLDRFMSAGKAGDLLAGRKLCTFDAAQRLTQAKPRKVDYKIRDVLVMSRRARAVVWQRYPEVTDWNNQVLIEYRLYEDSSRGWLIERFKLRSAWGDEAERSEP